MHVQSLESQAWCARSVDGSVPCTNVLACVAPWSRKKRKTSYHVSLGCSRRWSSIPQKKNALKQLAFSTNWDRKSKPHTRRSGCGEDPTAPLPQIIDTFLFVHSQTGHFLSFGGTFLFLMDCSGAHLNWAGSGRFWWTPHQGSPARLNHLMLPWMPLSAAYEN